MLAILPIAKYAPKKPPHVDEVTVDFLEPSTGAGTLTHTSSLTHSLTPTSTRTLAFTGTRTSTTHETTSTENTSTEIETEPSPSPSSSAMPIGPASLGLSGPGSFRMEIARQQPNEQEAQNENLRHVIMDPIHERERLNGSLTSGPFAQELERSTRADSGSPFEGRALFSIRVDEVGLVVSVQVAESSGDRHAWEDVGRRLLNAMAARRVRVPPGAKGVAMQIEITSKVTLPSGARSPLHVNSPAADAVSDMAKGKFEKGQDMNGSVPIVGGSFDLSDIGAHPLRVVGARVLSENVY